MVWNVEWTISLYGTISAWEDFAQANEPNLTIWFFLNYQGDRKHGTQLALNWFMSKYLLDKFKWVQPQKQCGHLPLPWIESSDNEIEFCFKACSNYTVAQNKPDTIKIGIISWCFIGPKILYYGVIDMTVGILIMHTFSL